MCRIEVFAKDLLWSFFSDLFDFDAPFARYHQQWQLCCAIQDDRCIEFASDIASLFEKDLVYGRSGRAGLNRNESIADHVLGCCSGFLPASSPAFTKRPMSE